MSCLTYNNMQLNALCVVTHDTATVSRDYYSTCHIFCITIGHTTPRGTVVNFYYRPHEIFTILSRHESVALLCDFIIQNFVQLCQHSSSVIWSTHYLAHSSVTSCEPSNIILFVSHQALAVCALRLFHIIAVL